MSDQRVIIFEGPDGCGKSNIAEAVSNLLNIPIFKNEDEWQHFPEKDKSTYFINAIRYAHPHLLSFIKQTKGSVILDRAYPSEYVYSKIFDRETDFTAIRACDLACKQLKAEIFIFVRSDYSNVKDQFDFVDKDMLERIHKEYNSFAAWTSNRVHFINVDDEDLDREISEVLRVLRK